MRKVPVYKMSEVPDEIGALWVAPREQKIELKLDRAQRFLDNLFPDGQIRLTVVRDHRRYKLSRD